MASPLQTIPELRDIFKAAKLYLEGEVSIIELHGVVAQHEKLAKIVKLSPSIIEFLEEWRVMIYNRWNEWNDAQHPLTEEEFTSWLKEQLVFD